MNWMKTILLVVAAAVIGAGGAYWLAPKSKETTTVIVTVEGIRKVAQLAAVEYRLSTLVDKTFQSRVLGGTRDSSRMLAFYTGTVKGSIDLQKIQLHLKDEGKASGAPAQGGLPRRALIHFPQGSIVIKDVALVPGEDSMREEVVWVGSYAGVSFNKPTDQQREAVRQEALKAILQTAIKQGIVDKTKENARTILTEFLAGLGVAAEVSFDDQAFHSADPALAKVAESQAKK